MPTATDAVTSHHATGMPVVRAIIDEAFQMARADHRAYRQFWLGGRLNQSEHAVDRKTSSVLRVSLPKCV